MKVEMVAGNVSSLIGSRICLVGLLGGLKTFASARAELLALPKDTLQYHFSESQNFP